jgi:hypothetical protein
MLLPLDKFNRNNSSNDGRRGNCKKCKTPANTKVIKEKVCSKCGELKKASEYHKNSRLSHGLMSNCKTCVAEKDKDYRSKNKKKVAKRNKIWNVKNKKTRKVKKSNYSKTAKGIFLKLSERENLVNISLEDFELWINDQEEKCYYCDCDLAQSRMILQHFGHKRKSLRLQIDRMDNALGYQIGNLCLACHTCNVHKKDFFSGVEFREIAQRYLVPKFSEILSSK